jgi:formylglycine-generating enzyme
MRYLTDKRLAGPAQVPAHDAWRAPVGPYPAPAAGMAWIPGGTFRMGADDQYPEEAPVREVGVEGFWMDRYVVTNRDFARFVSRTGYLTLAERPETAASSVFMSPRQPVELSDPYRWWAYVPGASWRRPQGPGSSVRSYPDHPVVHVAWPDVEAYARWAGKAVPTEAEWEYAARGGLDGATYAWGDEYAPGGRYLANTWQGEFPVHNTVEDGFECTAPVGSFPANGYGLYDMTGNVWEWTDDWYTGPAAPPEPCCPDGDAADPVPRKVLKGGSYLCAPNYCHRYRPAARVPHAVDTSASHIGFRCVVRPAG